MDKYNLKDCPFCGSSAIITEEDFYYYYVGCSGENCFVMPSLVGEDVNEMVIQWNTRTNVYVCN